MLATVTACRGGATPEVSAEAILERAAARMEQVKTFRYVLEFEGGSAAMARGLAMRRAEGAFAGVDNLDTTVLASLGPIDARVGIRVINGESWITNPLTGRWEREQISVAQLFDLSTGATALMRGATQTKVTGEETIEGVATRRIEGLVPSEQFRLLPDLPPGTQLRATAWVGVQDDFVRRLEVKGALFPATPAVEGTARVTLSHFDEPVVIGPPP